MHLERHGEVSRPRLLLLHGGGVAGWMWTPLREHLDPRTRLLIPDLPGHGRSAAEPYTSHEDAVRELETILEGDGPGPTTVVGFSLGAQLTVMLAAQRPDLVDRVVVISAQTLPTPAPDLTLALLRSTSGLARVRWFARLQAKELFIPPALLDDYLRTSAAMTSRSLVAAVGENIRFTIPDGWRAFPGRASVLAGSREKPLMRRSAQALHRALPGSTWEIVPDAGHGIPLQQPQLLARKLEQR
ncbi:alpha/beta hydrolase [Microbacterium sp. M28]|uniref:alpha/beta fold hydrolase n=1 Tax=Microbacterium sp. M28 TaxID=2962064 RepID=UPI0021F3E3D7|nr:alpha/beta hydrolase [Microbacterium sp. M28]UYO96923.1 alpha/beta hydrolase [Microbacterium sp. M28]